MIFCRSLIVLNIVTFFAVFSLIGSSASAEYKIRYVGSSTVGKFIKDASVTYSQTKFEINTKPESDGGESAVTAGNADLGGVDREVKPNVLDKGVKQYLIGKDPNGT